jgi:NAD(P)-dependent dehydrogenase (short-subunit alcohol dehydrogenase family)
MYLKKYNLKNKIALVSGAGKGLGRACAIALAEAGCNLIIISRTKKDLDEVSRKIKKFKVKCKTFVCDITNYNDLKNIINKQPRIDILINNAGNNIPEHFTKVKTKNMEYLVKVNTIAAFNLAQLCTLKMIKLKNRKKVGGAIINMSSQMGHVGGPIRSVYNMTKFGLEGLTKGMSIDLAKYNIRVNTVCPTFVVTPMKKKKKKSKKFKKEVLGNIPLGRFAELSDVASAAVFLASDAALATSESSANLPRGILPKTSFLNFLLFFFFFFIGVTTKVGHTVFTLILYFARSIDIPLVSPSNPNLVML